MDIIYDLGTSAARLCLTVISADKACVANADVNSAEGKSLELVTRTWDLAQKMASGTETWDLANR